MSRRLPGEGSIIWNTSKKTYAVSITVDGKKIYKYRKDKDEAVKLLRDLRAQHGLLTYSQEMTLGEWYPDWLHEIRASSLTPKTIADYDRIFHNYIESAPISKMIISQITKNDITRFFNQLAKKGVSIQMIKKIKLRLSACFNGADEYILKNPVTHAILPKAEDHSRSYSKDGLKLHLSSEGAYNAFTPAEQEKLITELLKGQDWHSDPLILFILGTGLRLGEALALNYNLDIRDGQVLVRRTYQRSPIIEDRKVVGYEKIFKEPKTKGSIRSVKMPQLINKAVKDRIAQIRELAKDPHYHDQGLLFPDEIGDILHDARPLRRLRALEKELGLSAINIHGLRHSYATRLLESGRPIQVISKLLGHSRVELTQAIYAHVMDDLKDDTVDALDDILGHTEDILSPENDNLTETNKVELEPPQST